MIHLKCDYCGKVWEHDLETHPITKGWGQDGQLVLTIPIGWGVGINTYFTRGGSLYHEQRREYTLSCTRCKVDPKTELEVEET